MSEVEVVFPITRSGGLSLLPSHSSSSVQACLGRKSSWLLLPLLPPPSPPARPNGSMVLLCTMSPLPLPLGLTALPPPPSPPPSQPSWEMYGRWKVKNCLLDLLSRAMGTLQGEMLVGARKSTWDNAES